MYHSKKIGIFISHIFGNFQSSLCQGIIDKATEFGYITEIFSSIDGEDVGNYSLGESSILRIPNYDEFSGVCFASDTYLLPSLKENIYNTLKEKCVCPIIEITQTSSVFPSIRLANNKVAEQLTEHMISTHHHKRICFLGNSTESFFSQERFRYYRQTMEKHQLAVSDYDFYFCDYAYESIEAALEHFLSAEQKPDSIICYNDRMAISLMEALRKRGFLIPDDIAVTGFDDLEIGWNISPALSTVTFPIYEMGQQAMELLLDAIRGTSLPDNTDILATPIYRCSCGCRKKASNTLLYENRLMEQINALEGSMLNDIKMSSALSGVHDLEEGMDVLEKFIPRIYNCHEFYICLYQNWDSLPSHIQEITSAEEDDEDLDILIMPFAYKDGKPTHKCSFAKKSTLPDYIYANAQSFYIYSPLFFQDKEFGYVALSYKENKLAYPFNFFTWIVNISRMLKNICEMKQTDLLINRLEDIYMKDDLTGLYNRKGFRLMTTPHLEQAKINKKPLLTMLFNLDGLKTINDAFGHLEGNFAIQVLGHALEHACRKDMIIARLGGDAFYALAPSLTEEDAKEMAQDINKYLENYNKLHTKKYNICVSSGYALKDVENTIDIHEFFNAAEQQMYLEKKTKDKHILK